MYQFKALTRITARAYKVTQVRGVKGMWPGAVNQNPKTRNSKHGDLFCQERQISSLAHPWNI